MSRLSSDQQTYHSIPEAMLQILIQDDPLNQDLALRMICSPAFASQRGGPLSRSMESIC